MPTLSFRTAATTEDGLSNRKFNVVPPSGAILNLWASCVTITDVFGLSIGDRDIVTMGALCNIEDSTGVVDTDRDQVVFSEFVGPGQLFLPATMTTAINFLIHLRYL